ncbi:phenylacetate--CoA ligase family protein [Psychrobacter glacincola]|uniref:Phenylacetate--CoA ligase family protein n=1 Tax=Psychrobacter glacincola TaxID=56810 RepID=A0ABW1WC23_9GAMM|nr:phenylacetate--CoA ligase family protein [Psychrobacter glacincola]
MSKAEKVFKATPFLLQNTAISIWNTRLYKQRHNGDYNYFRCFYKSTEDMSNNDIQNEINKKKKYFHAIVTSKSEWYLPYKLTDLKDFPILEKEDLISSFDKIKTINESEGITSHTGGTTGASMKVVYTKSNMQERFAILDHFRAKHGYELGKKTAWFSGKNLISDKDLQKGICSHYDFFNKIRFYSTFHINEKNFDVYWKSLNKFSPEFIVGFPFSVYEICEIADRRGLSLKNKVNVFFPNAENLLPHYREVIGRVLGCKIIDQYASSEGAPFILECVEGSLHINPFTGIFEVVDENMEPAIEGEVLVTSFTTVGTPLVRYRIGDRIRLADPNKTCKCGSSFPLVENLEGRKTDFIFSFERGRISLANLSNSTKGTKGIVCFQVIQEVETEISVKIVINDQYNKSEEDKFIYALRERVGNNINIDVKYVKDIPREKSGKFRFVKNNLELK